MLECAGAWFPIPGQIFRISLDVVNNVIPGCTDLYVRVIDVIYAMMEGIGVIGK